MTEPKFVPDEVPPPWPSDLPTPAVVDRGDHAEWISRFPADWRHGPWSLREVLRRTGGELPLLASARDAVPVAWEQALFLDLEVGTHPRGGACLFLAGTARFDAGELIVTQRLARDAEGERAVVAALIAELAAARELFTFSGKSFDLPMTKARAKSHELTVAWPARHFDLYRMAGKLLRNRFSDQRLQTFERELLHFERQGDLPGSAMPLAWHELGEPGGAALRIAVLRHNLFDVLALPSLAAELAFRVESPQEPDEREQLAAAHLARGNDRTTIEAALEVDPDSFRARLELSKLVEREEGDLSSALQHAEHALELAPDHQKDAAKRRIAQLRRRMARLGWQEE
ncbi:MAG: hypothetical protein EXS13_13910 [Planctomycetes bacterium]|nr:hypothetical protein [Planctomycetota bacterium]